MQTILRSNWGTSPVVEIACNETVLVVAGDAVHMPPELVSADIARGAQLSLSLEEGGPRDAVILNNLRARGILWIGVWEVLGADGSVRCTFESTLEHREAWGLALLPEPWPETLTIRFTPATTSSIGGSVVRSPDGVSWTGVVRFTFSYAGEDRRMQSKVGRYRLTDAALE